MEDRISVERWIDWLLVFGEKLLMSPAPNHHLGKQMVTLGELGIGKVGELSYDIGIRLLDREFIEINDVNEETKAPSTTVPETSDNLPDSPGQELIRHLGDLLWESREAETATTQAKLEIVDEDTITSLQELSWEYHAVPTASVDEDTIENLQELNWEYHIAPTELVDDNIIENPPELSWQEQTAPTDVVDATTNLQELSWEYQQAEFTAPPLLMPAQEDVISNLSELVLDYREQNSAAIVSTQSNWDESLVNLDPNVAYTLDELMVRLD